MSGYLRDFDSVIKTVVAVSAANHATGTVEHAGVDTNNAEGVRLVYNFADEGSSGTFLVKVQDSETGVVDSIAAATFTGSGLDDGAFGGTYTGSVAATFDVVIDGTGTPDTFKWRKDAGAYTTGVAITGSAQTLSDGVTVTFLATTGHTLTDKWSTTTVADTYANVSGKTTATLSTPENGAIDCFQATRRYVRAVTTVATDAVDAGAWFVIYANRLSPNPL